MTESLSHRVAIAAAGAVFVVGLAFAAPAHAQSKSIDDSLGGEKLQDAKPDTRQGGTGEGSGPGVRSTTNPNCDPTFGGRYAGLVRKLHIPADRRQYGMCRNYGRWNGTSYRGFRFRSGLFWTYDGTHWYLFSTVRTASAVRSTTNPNCDPTFGGRYAGLVRKLFIPADRRQYGMCRNYGRWNGTRYRGFRFRTGLYWTFDGTHWYLFASRTR